MTFSIFIPEQKVRCEAPPAVLFYLSGLTCTDENARTKAPSIYEVASKYNIAVVFPDTSPRDTKIGENDKYYLGHGAGYYLNASTDGYKDHFNMSSYILKDLPEIVKSLFSVDMSKMAITGHSMGGHGALVTHLKNPGLFKSVSAFAPISNPTQCQWGQEAFPLYLGSIDAGKEWDATELVKKYNGPKLPILIDQGTGD